MTATLNSVNAPNTLYLARAGGFASQKNTLFALDPSKTYIPGIHLYAKEREEAGESRDRDNEFYYLSFRLHDDFVNEFKTRTPKWGFPVGGNVTLGEINWLTKYSARKLDGTKERFWEGLRRVIEGMYSIQKEHALRYRLPWNEKTAHASAQEAYERCFEGKWSPPGRGFWKMGHFFVNGLGDSSALQNCAFISTAHIARTGDPSFPFYRLMEMSMLGIGVGFDTKGAGKIRIWEPEENDSHPITVDDSREGWYESVRMLLDSYFINRSQAVTFNYSEIRPSGEPIKGFGGTAAGPEPLIQLHVRLHNLLGGRRGERLTSTDIVDIMNMIGKCVVAANVRSSAEIALGDPNDEDFINLKNPEINPERMGFVKGPDGGPLKKKGVWVNSEAGGWGYTSNNTILAEVGEHYDQIGERIAQNGEPGLVWLDVCRKYGRLADPANDKDKRVMGVNPCAEQPLEHNELCTLVETYPTNCTDLKDFKRTLKFAYLYGKSVTLLPTHWEETNEVMMRNRRIGTSMSGLAQFVETLGWNELRKWQDEGYAVIKEWDTTYSEWLGIRESIKVTTIKPSGTVSLLFGVTPGAHWPTERSQYLRRLRLRIGDPVAIAMEAAGFHVEPNVQNPDFGVVVTCPTQGPDIHSEREVSVYMKVMLAALCQEWWSDNAVSLTASFMQEAEGKEIAPILAAFNGKLKSISFLPMSDETLPFPQMPYEKVSDVEWEKSWNKVGNLDWDALYAGAAEDAEGERYCTTDKCEIP